MPTFPVALKMPTLMVRIEQAAVAGAEFQPLAILKPAGCHGRPMPMLLLRCWRADVVAGVGEALVEVARVPEADVVVPTFPKPML